VGRNPSIHVTGAGGQVGTELRTVLPGATFWPHSELDVSRPAMVRERLTGADVVVHLAAFTRVDECETHPDRAVAVNDRGTANVVAAATEQGARVVYVSTDYVFDGTKTGEYSENDPPHPLNVYGRSKLAGEAHVADAEDGLIVRTSWVFGPGVNFVATILAAARRGDRIRVVDDQVGRPTWARGLAEALVHVLDAGTTGYLHVAGEGAPCTWADMAETALRAAGLSNPVERVTTSAYARVAGRALAPRPPNSALGLELARGAGVPLTDWRRSVEDYVWEAS
jgi:dTDP-4-dehydrorhamnose reductase